MNEILCIGAAHVDRKAYAQGEVHMHSSIPVSTHASLGGVARNVAENLARLACPVSLLSRIGQDKEGEWVRNHSETLGIDTEGITVSTTRSTASYTALLDGQGEMVLGLADMDIYQELNPESVYEMKELLQCHPIWFLDTNPSVETLTALLELATDEHLLLVDPVSIAKTSKLKTLLPRIDFLFPNREEAEVLSGIAVHSPDDAIKAARIICEKGVKHVIITLGEQGVCVATREWSQIFPALPAKVQDVTGAGDSLIAGFLFGYLRTRSVQDAIPYGIAAATLTIETEETVHPLLTPELLLQKANQKGATPFMQQYLDLHPDVAAALAEGRPVVALESTIISHGMPYPENVNTAREVEAVIREQGAVPATIGIIAGRIKIGLSDEELEAFGQASNVHKVSRRDLPYMLATKQHGATTVAATMICADLAGIRVFVTGGLGGVHREGEVTMDISADLQELAQTNVAVVCAGAKSILDLGRTLEYLETQGVPVVGYQTDDFPAFYTRTSGYGVDSRINTPEEMAEMLKIKWELGLNGGVVIANPVPEAYALDFDEMERHIAHGLQEAKEQGIKGKEVTPFLLGKMKELTGGKSLEANIALVLNNAFVGAQIARAYAGIGE